jgi:hypothetical protein
MDPLGGPKMPVDRKQTGSRGRGVKPTRLTKNGHSMAHDSRLMALHVDAYATVPDCARRHINLEN